MELPEFVTSITFWIKFAICYGLFVIFPMFFLNFTGSLSIIEKMFALILSAIAIAFALNGKTIKYGKYRNQTQYQ